MPATELRMSINDDVPFKIVNDGFEDEEDGNELDETKAHQDTFKK